MWVPFRCPHGRPAQPRPHSRLAQLSARSTGAAARAGIAGAPRLIRVCTTSVPCLYKSDFASAQLRFQGQFRTCADTESDLCRRQTPQTGQETENASSDETCLPKSQVRPEIRLVQTENLPSRQYGNENQEQIPPKRRLAETAQTSRAASRSQRYEINGTKADGTKPTASYTRVVARAITCDWVVM